MKHSLEYVRDANERPDNSFKLILLDRVMKCNNFDFDGKHYLKVGGNATVTKVASSNAHTFRVMYGENSICENKTIKYY